MSNPRRGELEIVLGEKKYKAKITLDVVMRIEQACGRSIVQIAQSLSAGELTTTQMLAVITPTIRAGGNDVNEKDIGKSLWDAGLADGMKAIGEIVSQVLTSEEDEGNGEEAGKLL